MTHEAKSVDTCYPVVDMDLVHVSSKSNVTETSYGRSTSKVNRLLKHARVEVNSGARRRGGWRRDGGGKGRRRGGMRGEEWGRT